MPWSSLRCSLFIYNDGNCDGQHDCDHEVLQIDVTRYNYAAVMVASAACFHGGIMRSGELETPMMTGFSRRGIATVNSWLA
jgi:hypothetical protein